MTIQLSGSTGISAGAAQFLVGQVAFFAMNAAPTGFLKCSGQAVDRTVYTALDAAIYVGDANNATATYGYRCTNSSTPSTSRSTTGTYIVLPDLRGEFIRCFDDGKGTDSGRAFGSSQGHALQSHTHTVGAGTENFGAGLGGGVYVNEAQLSRYSSNTGAHNGNSAAETRPRNIALLACIFAGA